MELRDLEPLAFDLGRWVKQAPTLESVMFRDGGKFSMLPFFGHVFVGFDSIPDRRWQGHLVSDLWRLRAPAFKCPPAWSMAKVLGALGAFSSVGEAKRNGWDFRPEPGWSDLKVRIAKRQGIITVVTPTDAVLRTDSF